MSVEVPLQVFRPRDPKPAWLKVRAPGSETYLRLKGLMQELELNTVCEEARCPNIGECWHQGTATFMILGDVCTRACAYCAVTHGRPNELDLGEPGRVSSNPPGRHAGNLDNRELVAGSTLFIPIFVRGALFEIGDGHAAQGDGEVSQTAIETSLRGRVQLTVRKDMKLTWPRADTAADYISMGTDADLKVATTIAIQEMVDFLADTRALSKHEAYQLVSIAGHVAITQLVDKPVYGVHVRMPKSIFKGK